MSIKLVTEVLDCAPHSLSLGETLLLVVIAESANTVTRECWPGLPELLSRTRTTESGLRRIMQRLADRDLEVRIPIGKDSLGRPVFARKGQQTRYRLPEFPPRLGGTTVPPKTPPLGGTTVPPSDTPKAVPMSPEGTFKAVRIGSIGGTTVPPFPSRTFKEQDQRQPTNTRSAPPDEEIVDAELVDVDLFGNPVEDPQPSPVPALVAAYVDALRADGGVATQSMIGAIGKNAKRLIEVDKLHPAVVMIAIQRAAAQRSRTLDRFLGTAQATFDRGGQARRDLFASWQKMHDQAIGEENKQIGNP